LLAGAPIQARFFFVLQSDSTGSAVTISPRRQFATLARLHDGGVRFAREPAGRASSRWEAGAKIRDVVRGWKGKRGTRQPPGRFGR